MNTVHHSFPAQQNYQTLNGEPCFAEASTRRRSRKESSIKAQKLALKHYMFI
jgi:hypothetical protein